MTENKAPWMKRKDVLIIAGFLLLAVVGMAVVWLSGRDTAAERALIYVGSGSSEPYAVVDLSEDQVIEIDQGSGVVNHVEVKDGAIRMLDSTCSDKQCVYQGEMSMENYERRILRNWVVCLPNQVVIELDLQGEG